MTEIFTPRSIWNFTRYFFLPVLFSGPSDTGFNFSGCIGRENCGIIGNRFGNFRQILSTVHKMWDFEFKFLFRRLDISLKQSSRSINGNLTTNFITGLRFTKVMIGRAICVYVIVMRRY